MSRPPIGYDKPFEPKHALQDSAQRQRVGATVRAVDLVVCHAGDAQSERKTLSDKVSSDVVSRLTAAHDAANTSLNRPFPRRQVDLHDRAQVRVVGAEPAVVLLVVQDEMLAVGDHAGTLSARLLLALFGRMQPRCQQ